MADEDENRPFKNDLQGPQGATNPFMNEKVGFTRERINLRGNPIEEVSDADMQALRDAQPSYEAPVPLSPLRRQEMPEDQRSMFDWKTDKGRNGEVPSAESGGEFETKVVNHLGQPAHQGFNVDGPPQPI